MRARILSRSASASASAASASDAAASACARRSAASAIAGSAAAVSVVVVIGGSFETGCCAAGSPQDVRHGRRCQSGEALVQASRGLRGVSGGDGLDALPETPLARGLGLGGRLGPLGGDAVLLVAQCGDLGAERGGVRAVHKR